MPCAHRQCTSLALAWTKAVNMYTRLLVSDAEATQREAELDPITRLGRSLVGL